jgi:hypothetical protein
MIPTALYTQHLHYYIKTTYYAIPLRRIFRTCLDLLVLYRVVSSFDVLGGILLCILTSSLRAPLLSLPIPRSSVSVEYLMVCLTHPRIEL